MFGARRTGPGVGPGLAGGITHPGWPGRASGFNHEEVENSADEEEAWKTLLSLLPLDLTSDQREKTDGWMRQSADST